MQNHIQLSLRSDEIEALKKEFPDKSPGMAAKEILRKQIAFIITRHLRNESKELETWTLRPTPEEKEIQETMIKIAKTPWIDDD